MNTRISFAAALVIIAAAMLISPVTSAWAEGGASSPEALGNKVLESIKTQNKDGIKSLIHPEVIAFMNKSNPAELDNIIGNLLALKIPKNTEFVVQPMEEVSEYDQATQTLTFRDNKLYFPVAPSDLLVLVTEAEIAKKDDKGVETKTKAKVGVMVNTITQYNQAWYIVLPVKKNAEKPEEKKQ